MSQAVKFIRKNGRVIPIRAAGASAGRAATTAVKGAVIGTGAVAHKMLEQHRSNKQKTIKVNPLMNIAGLGLSVASGVVAAATFGTPKGFVGGHIAAHAIDAVGVAANVSSVAGKGHAKERAVLGAKQEFRNLAIGNAVYAAGVLGVASNRKAAVAYAGKVGALAKKFLRGV